jgi:hypothetical protein
MPEFERFSVSTIQVSSNFRVYPGETLNFTNETGFFIQENIPTPAPNLTVEGAVVVTMTASQQGGLPSVVGIAIGMSGFYNSTVTIEATGSFRVTATAPDVSAWGYSSGSWSPDFINKGTFVVSANGQATGLSTWDAGTIIVDNQGSFTVTSAASSASGVILANGGKFSNSGVIDVHGAGGGYTYGIATAAHEESFLNTGVIRAVNPDAAVNAIAVSWGFGIYHGSWVNQGLLEGEVALRASIYSGTPSAINYTNAGTMTGSVELTYARDTFWNSGTINGVINLGLGDDQYDGHLGVLTNSLFAGDGADSVAGGAAAETLNGEAGADTISGGAGDDIVDGGRDGDVLDGGVGADTVTYASATMGVKLDLAAGTADSSGADTLTGFERVIGGVFADTLTGSAGTDSLSGGAGGDSLSGGAGSNYLRGDDGDDLVVGGSGFDDINGNMGNDTASGGLGDDWVVGGKDNDSLSGDAGGDIVWGNLGNDTLDGGDGADQVRGGQGDDVVNGGAGDDFVSGDRGNDTITGGGGADLFHGSQDAGIDRVLDFHASEGDRVMLDPGTAYTLSQAGADTVIDMGGGHQMVLVGVQYASLAAGWIFLG